MSQVSFYQPLRVISHLFQERLSRVAVTSSQAAPIVDLTSSDARFLYATGLIEIVLYFEKSCSKDGFNF